MQILLNMSLKFLKGVRNKYSAKISQQNLLNPFSCKKINCTVKFGNSCCDDIPFCLMQSNF